VNLCSVKLKKAFRGELAGENLVYRTKLELKAGTRNQLKKVFNQLTGGQLWN
jgi:hypothetical protein